MRDSWPDGSCIFVFPGSVRTLSNFFASDVTQCPPEFCISFMSLTGDASRQRTVVRFSSQDDNRMPLGPMLALKLYTSGWWSVEASWNVNEAAVVFQKPSCDVI